MYLCIVISTGLIGNFPETSYFPPVLQKEGHELNLVACEWDPFWKKKIFFQV